MLNCGLALVRSAAGALDLESAGFEFSDKGVAMVALDFDDAVLQRAARPALSLEITRELLELLGIDRNAGDR